MLKMTTFRIVLVLLKLSSVFSLSELMLNISRDLYEFCPITNFNGRSTNESFILETANEQDFLSEFRRTISCCSSCSSAPDCGERELCCPDMEFYKDIGLTCKHPIYIDKTVGSDTSVGKNFHFAAANEPTLFMMQTCAPEFVDTEMEYNCLNARINDVDDPRNITPVVDVLMYNVYANIFCATCNGLVDTIDTQFFTALFRCSMQAMVRVIGSTKDERQLLMTNQECFYHFQPNNASLVSAVRCDYYRSRPCKGSGETETTELLSAIDKYNQEACNAYTLPVYTGNVNRYKNVHCMLCAYGGTPNKLDTLCYKYFTLGQPTLSFSFYLILSNSKKAGIGESTNTQRQQCPVAMFYDPYKDECRNVTCSRLKTKTNAGCEEVFSSYTGLYWSISLLWKQIGTNNNNTTQTVSLIFEEAASTIKNRLPDRYEDAFELEIFVVNNQDEQLWIYIILRWKSMAGQGLFTEPTQNFIDEHGGRGTTFEIYLNGTTFRFQATLFKSIYEDDPNVQTTISLHGRELVKSYSESKRQLDYRFSLQAIPISKMLLCDQVLLDTNEYTVLEDDVISLINSDILLSETEYVIDESGNGTIYVCIDDYFRGSSSSVTMSNLVDDIAIIISFACSLISIVCLLVVLITYTSFASLRTVPGKINMCLCSSLLVAQTLQQFAMDQTQFETMCVVFGSLIHYFWLYTLFWMNICSFNMFRLFSIIPIQVPFLIEQNLIVFYSVYASISPLICVIINMLVSLMTSNWNDFGYGPAVCYISSSSMVFYTFTLPVVVLVVLNIAFLTLTILGISVVKRPGENNTNNRNDALIFLKLSTLTGVCWVFGFLRLWTGHIVFEYMFIFANATQGFFLMISFVCNRRIIGMYRQHFQKTTLTAAT